MKIYGITKIGPKGQVVILQEARKDLKINPGDKVVVFSPHGKGIVIAPVEELKKYLSEFVDVLDKNDK